MAVLFCFVSTTRRPALPPRTTPYIEDANGNSYSGEYLNGKAHGRGVFTWSESKCRFEGRWAAGEKVKGLLAFHDDGTEYEGGFRGGKFHGTAADGQGDNRHTFADGSVYVSRCPGFYLRTCVSSWVIPFFAFHSR